MPAIFAKNFPQRTIRCKTLDSHAERGEKDCQWLLPGTMQCKMRRLRVRGYFPTGKFKRQAGFVMSMKMVSGSILALSLLLHTAQAAEKEPALPTVEVFLPGLCLSCMDWADHLRANGFAVLLRETADMPALKRRLKIPPEVESVHTAMVAGYFVEGHVSADDIKLLLLEKPKARGLAVPGLPAGAPGREASNPVCETACTILDSGSAEREIRREMYNTLLVAPDGKTSVFARH